MKAESATLSDSATRLTASADDEWRRLSVLSVFSLAGGLVSSLYSLAAAAVVLSNMLGWSVARMVLAGGGLLVLWLLFGVLQYLNFKYLVSEDGVRIRKGVLSRNEVFIRYPRVQSVQATSGPLYRIAGLVRLNLDTAGASQQEGVLPGVPPELADDIRDRIEAARAGAQSPASTMNENTSDPGHAAAVGREQLLLQLPASELIRIGLTSSHVFFIFAGLAAATGPLMDIGLITAAENWGLAEKFSEFRSAARLTIVIGLLLILCAVLSLMLVGSLFSAFLRFHGYTLIRAGKQLRTRAGLLTVSEKSMNRNKVQTVSVRQSLLRRWLDRVAIDLRQAGGPAQKSRRSQGGSEHPRLVIPLALPTFARVMTDDVFGDDAKDLDVHPGSVAFGPISNRFIAARFRLAGLLPGLVILVYGYLNSQLLWAAAAAVLWVTIALAACLLRHRRWGVQVRGEAIGIRSGWLGTRIDAFTCQKVQSVDLRATPLQQRAQVATLTIHLASHSLRVPYLNRADATALRDYLLYRVESSSQASF